MYINLYMGIQGKASGACYIATVGVHNYVAIKLPFSRRVWYNESCKGD